MDSKTQPNYITELLMHDNNVYAASVAVAFSVLVSIPWGSMGWLPLLGFAAVETLLLLGVPSTQRWRNYVDERANQRHREESRSRLIDDLNANMGNNSSSRQVKAYASSYQQMYTRVKAMYDIAADKRSQLSKADVDKFNDSTLNYLSMIIAWRTLDTGSGYGRRVDAEDQINAINNRLRGNVSESEKPQLLKAKQEYQGIIDRAERRNTRRTALEASLATMPDKMEEVYQMLVSAPYSTDIGNRMEESLHKLMLQEEVDALIAAELDPLGLETVEMNVSKGTAKRQSVNVAQ